MDNEYREKKRTIDEQQSSFLSTSRRILTRPTILVKHFSSAFRIGSAALPPGSHDEPAGRYFIPMRLRIAAVMLCLVRA